MNIFIAGGGRVGFHLTRLLCAENHDLTVIETGADRLEQIDYALDVKTIQGNAASVMLLKEAGAEDAGLFVALTGRDEVNLIAAAAAKGLGAKQVVARVDNPTYIESSLLYETMMGLDYVLSPDALAALEIANYIETSGIVAAEYFGRGRVQMRQMRVSKSPTVRGKKLRDVCPPGGGVLLGTISRRGEILIPHGDTIVKSGDLVTLIGRSEEMDAVQKRFQGTEPRSGRMVVMGGGSVGLHLAQALENRRRSVKLFDWRMDQCEQLASVLKRTKVVCRDATSREALKQEHVDGAGVFVATTNDDERNIMAAVLAKEVGVDQTIAVVHHPDFAPLVGKLGIDHAVTPRACMASRILKLVHQEGLTSLAVLEEGEVEIVEVTVGVNAAIAGQRLRDLKSKLPDRALVAAIVRGDDVIVPSGEDTLEGADSVVLIVGSDSLESVLKLFSR
ncbi:MAG: Trk system potassium transporter TrkA [Nitrospiraceae bacterium]|nr:Trk system potassium transporter TrkA [Nitrospiraceae bacterium]